MTTTTTGLIHGDSCRKGGGWDGENFPCDTAGAAVRGHFNLASAVISRGDAVGTGGKLFWLRMIIIRIAAWWVSPWDTHRLFLLRPNNWHAGRVIALQEEWSISNFPYSFTWNKDTTLYEELGFSYLTLRWKIIIQPILTTSLIYFSLNWIGRMYVLNLGVKTLMRKWAAGT